jgi:uncharacterized protein (TIGR02147 family)
VVEARKRLDSKINYQNIATATRIPKSYLSKVVNGKADLSSDQLFQVCEFLKLDTAKIEYLTDLLEASRSTVKSRKKFLEQRIRTVKAKNLDVKAQLQAESVEPEMESISRYYLDPWIQVIHVSLSIKKYQHDLKLLAKDLQIPFSRVRSCVQVLQELEMIEVREDGLSLKKRNFHLAKDSIIFPAWRNQLRSVCADRINFNPIDQQFSFSVTFSCTEQIRARIKQRLNDVLQEIEGLVRESKEEESVQLNIDLFPWTCPIRD